MLGGKETVGTEKKISIIIPCYNCENTIGYCMEAVLAQTIGIPSMEVILVNDASTDNTLTKLYEYEKLYPDTVLIINCEENGRQGTARNIALSYATGEYIAYVDADDVMERNMYELLYQAALQTNAEVVVSANKRVAEIPCLDVLQNDKLLLKKVWEIQTAEDRKILLADEGINNAAWNKLYQRQFLIDHDIYFAERIIYEDILFTMLMKAYVSKLCILDNAFYYHVLLEESTSRSESFDEERVLAFLAVHAETIEEFKRRGKYNVYQHELFVWYVDMYLRCAVWYAGHYKKMNPEYIHIMDKSVEQLFPKMANISELHSLLLKVIRDQV